MSGKAVYGAENLLQTDEIVSCPTNEYRNACEVEELGTWEGDSSRYLALAVRDQRPERSSISTKNSNILSEYK